ncbi:MAG: hypothetical protein ACKVVP_24180 [Chloroflexota bacterium]
MASPQQDGRLAVFGYTAGPIDRQLSWITEDTTAPGGWTGWMDLGAPPGQSLGAMTVAQHADGRMQVFSRLGLMSSGVVWGISQQSANSAAWSSWTNLGAPPGGVSAHLLKSVQNADGRLELFALGQTAEVWHAWQSVPSGNAWSTWTSLGSPSGTPIIRLAAGRNAGGRLELFGLSSGGQLWNIWQTAPNSSWSDWNALGGPVGVSLGSLALGQNSDGRLEVFAIADGETLWHLWQDPTSGTSWSTWDNLGKPGSGFLDDPVVAQNSDGRLEAFAVLNDDALWHIWQDPASATFWSGWANLGGEPDGAVAVSRHLDGRLGAFAIARVTSGPAPLYHRAQTAPNGDWGPDPAWELTALASKIVQLSRASDGSIFARTATSLLRSIDQGDTWAPVNLPPGAGKVAVDPTSSSVIYAGGTGGLFKTLDRGASWSLIYTDLPQTKVIAVVVSEANNQIVYAATSNSSTDIDWVRTLNGGTVWMGIGGPFMGTLCSWGVNLLFPHPTDQMRLFRAAGCYAGRTVPSGDELEISTAQGAGWTTLLQQPTLFPSRMVGGKGIEPSRFYVGAHRGAEPGGGKLFATKDNGATWFTAIDLPSGPAIGGVEYDPKVPTRVYAALTSGEVRTSADAGFSWTQLGSAGLGRSEALLLVGGYLFLASDTGVWRYPI